MHSMSVPYNSADSGNRKAVVLDYSRRTENSFCVCNHDTKLLLISLAIGTELGGINTAVREFGRGRR